MTKVSVFGQTEKEENIELNKIEITHVCQYSGCFFASLYRNDDFEEIILIKRNYCSIDNKSLDAIIAIEDGSKHFCLGHWNDGVV